MSTKISALQERLVADIVGDEFFPIIDGGSLQNPRPAGDPFGTYKIRLDTLFASGQGYEKITNLVVTGAALPDRQTVADDNEKFTLTYTKEDNTTDVITIDKYKILANDVKFIHIDPAGYVTSTDRIDTHIVDDRLTTAKAVDTHIDHREALYDTEIKGYFGDSTTSRVTGNHVLKDFRLNSEVASDFTALLAGVKPELNTFKKIEEQFDTIDYSDKIGTSQVNTAHFRINGVDLSKRLNIKDSGITANLISVNAITNDKISNNAVTRTKISNGAISNDKIADVTITEAKIKDGTLTPNKLSSGAPDWNNTRVNIPVDLNVNSDIFVNENIISKGTDFRLYNAIRAGTNVHSGRALVHNVGDRLTINYANDYTGGVNIKGIVTVPDQDDAAINAGGNRAVVTKEYVDAADILLNPIAGDKIQDNAIALRHMSDNSVGTFEILDDSITSEKIENIGPQWNANGDVIVSGKLTANGQTFTLGSNATPSGNVSLSLLASVSGSAAITRKTGANGPLLINNTGGNIDFSPGSGTSTKFQVSSSKSTVSNPLHITGDGSSTIAGTNFTNPALLVGSSTNGIAIDSNEIMQKGNHLILGVSDGASQNIYFKEGVNTVATIYGNTGDIQADGDLITNTGIVRNNSDASRLILLGGKENKSGADIELYGINNTNHPGYAYYDADKHTFRSQDNTIVALTIDSKKKNVTLHGEGTATNHLVTKGYVDKNTFPKITTRDDITTRMDSGFYQTESASIAEGWPEDSGWYHLLTSTHSNTNNYHALQFAASHYDQEVYFRSTHDKGDREWNKLWHANNVGPNSGLDADLLDGKEASEFSLDGHSHDDRYRKLSTKIGKDDLTAGAPAWTSAGVSIPAILTVNDSATIGKSLTVEGSNITLNGTDFKIFNSTRAGSGNTHLGRALVHGTSDRLIINYAKDYTGGVEVNGKVIAPNQTITLINSNNKALTTKEYVTSEIAKIYPDDNYILKTGGNVSGNLAFTNQSGKGITWSKNTDSASIKFYNTGDGDSDCRLEFQTGDNRNEYFLFTHQPSGAAKINLLKISNSEISYKGNKLMTGIATNQVVSNMIKSGAVTSAKIGNSQVTTAKIGNSQVTTAKIGDSQVTEAKLANVAPGFLLGKGHSQSASAPNLVPIGTSITNTHDTVPSSQAVKAYTDSKVRGLATTAYVDNKVESYVDNKINDGKLYHVNAIQKSQKYYLTADVNSSSNVTPNAAVKTYAQAVLPNLVAGDTVMVVWGYRTEDASNGTTRAFQYATTLYSVVSSSTWNVIKHGRIS